VGDGVRVGVPVGVAVGVTLAVGVTDGDAVTPGEADGDGLPVACAAAGAATRTARPTAIPKPSSFLIFLIPSSFWPCAATRRPAGRYAGAAAWSARQACRRRSAWRW